MPGLGQGVMDNGKSRSLDTKTQFIAVYSIDNKGFYLSQNFIYRRKS